MLVKISDIKIGERFRKDLRDLGLLMDSIKRHGGVLVPIGITKDFHLVHGERRVAACKKLGITEIEAYILDRADANWREAEADENNCRLGFNPAEIAEYYRYHKEEEAKRARERMLSGKPCAKLPQGQSRKTRDIIAKRCGISGRKLDDIIKIELASLDGGFPEKIWSSVVSGKMEVHSGFNKVSRYQRIKEAEKRASNFELESNSNFDLKLGLMQEKGQEIADNSIDLIITDPPYSEESITLYGELAKLAQRVLKPGGSLITIIGHHALFKIGRQIEDNSELEYHWQIVLKHNGHTAKIWKQRVWPKYKPMLWYFKRERSGNGNNSHPTMYSDIEDLIESQPVDKTMHEWEQSTIEASHIIKPLTVEGQIILDPFMGYGTNGVAALELKRKFIGIEVVKEHYARASQRLSAFKLNFVQPQ